MTTTKEFKMEISIGLFLVNWLRSARLRANGQMSME